MLIYGALSYPGNRHESFLQDKHLHTSGQGSGFGFFHRAGAAGKHIDRKQSGQNNSNYSLVIHEKHILSLRKNYTIGINAMQ